MNDKVLLNLMLLDLTLSKLHNRKIYVHWRFLLHELQYCDFRRKLNLNLNLDLCIVV